MTATNPKENGSEVGTAGAVRISRRQSILAKTSLLSRRPGWDHLRDRLECEINVGSKQFAMSVRTTAPDAIDSARVSGIVNKNIVNRPALRLRLVKFKEVATRMRPYSR
ncbi:hypothetical protein ACQI5H_04195 [Mycobacterium heidelbergense]|uniref:hypothetical protein n=1 Tax=Mycobacterium heidelbergense TaxID=53376 RepID=UPI003CF34F64